MAACTSILPLATSTVAELCSFHTASGEYSTASHQLSHAPSRQRFKLKWSAPVVDSRGGLTSSILGDGGVHFDPAACNEHRSLQLTVSGEYSTASHQLSHASSRQRFKLNGHRSLVTMCQLATGKKHECKRGETLSNDAPPSNDAADGDAADGSRVGSSRATPRNCVAARLCLLFVYSLNRTHFWISVLAICVRSALSSGVV